MLVANRQIGMIREDVDKVNAFTDRIRKLKEETRARTGRLCPERSRLFTQSWKETEGEPLVLRKAKAYQKVLEGIPVVIRDGELIVGSVTKYPRGTYAYPEFWTGPFLKQLEARGVLYSDAGLPVEIVEEDRKALWEDCQYWKNRCVVAQVEKIVDELWGAKFHEHMEAGLWLHNWFLPPFTLNANYGKVLQIGLKGFIKDAREEMHQLGVPAKLEELEKYYFLQAVIITCESVIRFAKRYAQLARDMAEKELNEVRKAELVKIAEICKWVPENPARTFHEALQSYRFIALCIDLETLSIAQAPCRFDQYMYPFYERDIREGRITRDEAAELLGCMFIHWLGYEAFKDPDTAQRIGPGSMLQNLTIGGVTRDGRDATNELSFLILEVARQVRTHQPPISLRYHDGISKEFLIKAVEVNRDMGSGVPAFFNDKTALIRLTQYGIPLEEARDWAPMGCVMAFIPGASLKRHQAWISLAKCFELALHNGVDPRTGKQLGPATGDARNFTHFDELYEAFKKQWASVLEMATKVWVLDQMVIAQNYRTPFASGLLDDCIKNGKDQQEGGVRYPQLLPHITVFGGQNPADSLAAIKKLVFEEKIISMAELLDALAVNFEGKKELWRKLLTAPKYGNDDDYVDGILSDIFRWTEQDVTKFRWHLGHRLSISRIGITLHIYFGKFVGALPDGREAWEPLADAALSPMRGADMNGPTAMINSAVKMDVIGTNGTIHNMRLNPSMVRTREGINKFLALLKSYFDRYGYMVQVNMVSQETLLDAKKHPEKYRDLLVRVAGYSAYFVELPESLQDEIIARTEYSF